MKVKICGITNLEDALLAAELGADALGFIFYQRSARFIRPEQVREIIAQLPPFIEKVGVFVNSDATFVNKAIVASNITLAQIHFEASSEFYGSLVAPHLRVTRAQREADVNYLSQQHRIVDAYSENHGGQGEKIDLSWFKEADCSKIILAGGLTANNVKETLPYGFYGVDVSSGVESELGKKDPQKLKDFIATAKQC